MTTASRALPGAIFSKKTMSGTSAWPLQATRWAVSRLIKAPVPARGQVIPPGLVDSRLTHGAFSRACERAAGRPAAPVRVPVPAEAGLVEAQSQTTLAGRSA